MVKKKTFTRAKIEPYGDSWEPRSCVNREVELGSHIGSWTVFCFSYSQQLVLQILQLSSPQLLKEQIAKYTSCFALAGSTPPQLLLWWWQSFPILWVGAPGMSIIQVLDQPFSPLPNKLYEACVDVKPNITYIPIDALT